MQSHGQNNPSLKGFYLSFFVPTCGNFFWQDLQDYHYRIITFIHSYELSEFSFTISEIGLPYIYY